jgi:hypothetical protein
MMVRTCGAPPKSSPYAGTIGRGSVEMPGFQNWDFAVQRAFKMPVWKLENQSLTLRGEAYNVFNHPNLGIPELDPADTANFGNLASTIYGGRVLKLKLTYAF